MPQTTRQQLINGILHDVKLWCIPGFLLPQLKKKINYHPQNPSIHFMPSCNPSIFRLSEVSFKVVLGVGAGQFVECWRHRKSCAEENFGTFLAVAVDGLMLARTRHTMKSRFQVNFSYRNAVLKLNDLQVSGAPNSRKTVGC